MPLAIAHMPPGVFAAVDRRRHRSPSGKVHLAAMRVSADLQKGTRVALSKKVRLMRQKNRRFRRVDLGKRLVGVVKAVPGTPLQGALTVHADDPESAVGCLQPLRPV